MNTKSNAAAKARVCRPQRNQVEMHLAALDHLLPRDHPARIVWAYIGSLDLEPLYQNIKVSRTQAGRNATDPQLLVSLWLLATLDSIGSARELARRCEYDMRYKWMCGGVGVNHHTLSDFRVKNGEFLNQMLVDTVTSLIAKGLVPLHTIAQDGMRVRASAGSSSFRRLPSLEQLQQQVQAHVEQLEREHEDESGQPPNARQQAARERAARELQERIDEAIKQHGELSDKREKRKKGDGATTRCSTTDPDARRMKMANGGTNPAFNIQFATDGDSRIIVGVDVTNEGTDGGEMPPMHEEVCEVYEKTPEHQLVDGAFATKEGVTTVERRGTKVVSSVPRSEQLKKHGKDPHARQKGDTDEYEQFRQRMGEERYKEMYKLRPSIAEFPNAFCRNKGLRLLNVRGLKKVKAVALWHALAFNFTRMLNLGAIT